MKAASHSRLARRSEGSQAGRARPGRCRRGNRSPRSRGTAAPEAPGVSTAAAISSVVWIPVELVTPTAIGSSSTQSYGDDDRARAQAAERRGHRRRENGTIASSTVTERDRQVVALRVRDADADLAGLELDAADVELVARRRVAARAGRRASLRTTAKSETAPTRSSSGTSAQRRQPYPRAATRVRRHLIDDLEEAHPAELRELATGARGT